ncbi:hypothetical protein M422DRAFT_44928 [Sphaerobolus stellatus SS14]|nr:hypothetical protein M422DRAFT_44928 [Sphaerobolus stellatus SS14]
MPSKTAKAAAHLKNHNRNASTSSTGKLAGFNRNKSAEKIRRNASDLQHLVNVKHVQQQHPNPPRAHSPARRGLILTVETNNTDDDGEWVSSESGAATPAEEEEEDAPPTPRETRSTLPTVSSPAAFKPAPVLSSTSETFPTSTPRADPHPLPPPSDSSTSQRQRPRPQSLADFPRIETSTKFTAGGSPEPSPSPEPEPRRSITRPPSTRSATSMRPHPLIRTRSYAPATPTVSAAPPAFSPTTASSPLASPITNHPSSPDSARYSQFIPQLRRHGSRSSLASVSTLPLPAKTTGTTASTTRVHGERQRTLSQVSTSAALSSLAAAAHPQAHFYGIGSMPSRPPSPVLPTAFPPPNLRAEHEMPILPAPMAPSHASVMAHRRPMLDSFRRVIQGRTNGRR